MKRSVIRRVIAPYGLIAYNVIPCNSYYAEGVAYRVKTQRGLVMVKPYRGPSWRLSAVYRRVTNLRRKGYEHFPRWYVSKSGKAWMTDEGKLYYVTDWVEGRELGRSLFDYELLGRALGSLHRKASLASPVTRRESARKLGAYHNRCIRILKTQETPQTYIKLGSWYRSHHEEITRLAEQAWADVLGICNGRSDLRVSLIHGDVTIPNVIVTKNRAVLVDIEQLKPGLPSLELSKALANTTGFQVPKIEALLRGYETENPLSRTERRFLFASFRIPREFYMALETSQREGRTSNIATIFRDTWENRLNAIEWMKRWTQEKYESDSCP